MKKDLRTIKIGHGAYSGANALSFVIGKAAAVRELRLRGFKRDEARALIRRVTSRPDGYEIGETEFNLVEVRAMNSQMSWDGYA